MGKRGKNVTNKVKMQVSQMVKQGYGTSHIARHLGISESEVRKIRREKLPEERTQAWQQALAKHFEDLCEVTKQWHTQLEVPLFQILEILPATSDFYNKELSVGYTPDSEVGVKLSIEKEHLFGCLQQHLPQSPLWGLFVDWKAAIVKLASRLESLCKSLTSYPGLTQQVWISDDEFGRGNSGIISMFSKTIIADACEQAIRGSSLAEDYRFETNLPGQQVLTLFYYPGQVSFALAASSSPTDLNGYKELHLKLRSQLRNDSRIVDDFKTKYVELIRLKANLQSELEQIQLKRTFHGKCRLCPE